MKRVKFIGRYRGFLLDLFTYKNPNFQIEYENNDEFEIIKTNKQKLLRIFNNSKLDFLGLFTTLKTDNKADYLLSYNRFIQSKDGQKYSIILENPTALVNYSDTKMYSSRTKKKLGKLFSDPNLVAIVCMSDCCYRSMEIFYPSFQIEDKLFQIYPMIKDAGSINETFLKEQSRNETLNVLYISSNFTLKGGEDIIRSFKELSRSKISMKLTIITKVDNLTQNQKNQIEKLKNIKLVNFSLSRDELVEYYRTANILINPSRMDSFSLVTLEAIKYGCAIISSDIYAIKEMVIEGINGFLQSPKFNYWNSDGSINHYIKMNPHKTYDSEYIDEEMIEFITNRLMELNENRDKLSTFQINSYKLSCNDNFGEKSIAKQWEMIFK